MIPGSRFDNEGKCTFTVWAPHRRRVELELAAPDAGDSRLIEMQPCDERVEREVRACPDPCFRRGDVIPAKAGIAERVGYWQLRLHDIHPGSRYLFRLDGTVARPDPASNFQPQGVHGPSEVIDHRQFHWNDNEWIGIDLEDMIIYELHVGTFTPEGTFSAAMERLADLNNLGVTAIEIMPVAQFPGERNWGYDGAYPYAVQNSYGGPGKLKELINACHQTGMAVILDVVYNHLGPEGNYLRDFGPYFTDKYKTPWGRSLNFDGPHSNPVRDFFVENALYWFGEYHVDALRLDALHAIVDMSARHFLEELADRVEQFSHENGRKFHLIGESDLNDARLIEPRSSGGCGLDAQWSDDFHHSLHALLTGDKNGYYRDFGGVQDLAKAFKVGYVYTGQYSKYRKRCFGNSPKGRKARQFVVCAQNHDQVGNRKQGERLTQLVDFEALKLAAGAVILCPYVPLLFMGEEYGEDAPFLYFVSHKDKNLIEAVRRGRLEEFKSFDWQGDIPDPQAVSTFEQSTLHWNKRTAGRHAVLLEFYRTLIALRKSRPGFTGRRGMRVRCLAKKRTLLWHRRFARSQIQCAMSFAKEQQCLRLSAPAAQWRKILDSTDTKWLGPGSTLPETVQGSQIVTVPPMSIVLFESFETPSAEETLRAEQHIPAVTEASDVRTYSHV